MSTLPNPFTSSSEVVMPSVETAAAFSPSPPASDAAATPSRFVLDEERFLADIEPLPLFLQAPLDVMNMLATF